MVVGLENFSGLSCADEIPVTFTLADELFVTFFENIELSVACAV